MPPQLSASSFFLASQGLWGELSRLRAPWKSPSLQRGGLTCAPASHVAGLKPPRPGPGVGAPAATCCAPMHGPHPHRSQPRTLLWAPVTPPLLCPGVPAYSRRSISSPWLQWPPGRPFLRGRCCSRAGLLIGGWGHRREWWVGFEPRAPAWAAGGVGYRGLKKWGAGEHVRRPWGRMARGRGNGEGGAYNQGSTLGPHLATPTGQLAAAPGAAGSAPSGAGVLG